ncbi:transcriptional regulator ATRX-like protein [Gossypium australe]|uniref:Transcriptional regulator ATRX-like protein n=1 Tax=Gossypium australe TaxID=47621 RepID=A0A5B6WSX1_9ROSI|nr:transcriptional regulator ATRX-like protein [Gossypium australe]
MRGFFYSLCICFIIIGKLKNVTCYDEVAEMLKDSRLIYNEIDMEDSEYGQFFNNLEQFGFHPDGNDDGDDDDDDDVVATAAVAADGAGGGGGDDDNDDDDEEEELKKNPEYNCFLENLKLDENGESYTVQIPISSDLSLVLKYEGKEEESFENVDRQTNSKSNLKREKAKVSDILGGFPRKSRPDTVKRPLEIRVERSKKKLRNSPGQERQSEDNENKLEEEVEADPVACRSSGEPSKMMNYAIKDEHCTQFLVSLDKSGTKTEPSYEKGHQSTHQKNDGSCPDVEVFTLDNMPLCKGDYTPFVPSKCYQSLGFLVYFVPSVLYVVNSFTFFVSWFHGACCWKKKSGEECGDGIRSSSPSQFREQLMDLLKTPYNREEFQNLWRDVTQRKPVQGVKDLRHGRMKSYSTKTVGKSYLDWYKDLRTTVDEFRPDTRKVLCLLRGFFFWLKNTAHEGAFKPWTDRSYLKALTDQRNI